MALLKNLSSWMDSRQSSQSAWLNQSLAEAKVALEAGDAERAESLYLEILARQPECPEIYCPLGDLAASAWEWEQARQYYERSVALNCDVARAQLELGRICQQKGDLVQAVIHFGKATESSPASARAWLLLGQAQLDNGQFQQAFASFDKAGQLDPALPAAWLGKGNASFHLGDVEAARGCFEQALSLDTRLALAHVGIGNCQMAREEWAQARDSYSHAKELNPNAPYINEKLNEAIEKADPLEARRKGLNREADLAFNEGNLELAADLYRELHGLAPNLAHPLCRLGEIAQRDEDHVSAEQYYREAVSCQPDYAWARVGLGKCLARQRKWSAAAGHYRQAVQALPDNDYIQQILEQAEQEAASQAALVAERLARADHCFDTGELADAESQYKEALDVAGDPPVHALCRLGELAMKRKAVSEAEDYYRQATLADAGYAWAHCGFGNALMAQEKWPEAQLALSRALEIKPDEGYIANLYWQSRANLLLQAVSTALEQGQTEEARRALGQALLIQPDSTRARDAVQRLLGMKTVSAQGNSGQYELEVELNDCYNRGLEQWIANLAAGPADCRQA